MDEDDKAAEQRRAEAAQWFARLKTVPVSQGTLRDFFEWRRESRNAEAFEEAERFWTEAGKLGERPSILRAVEAAQARRAGSRNLRPLLMVATFAILMILSVAGFLHFSGRQPVIQTDTGELRLVALDDGSRVQLNAQTRIGVHFRDNSRQLVLQNGEALFRVAHDPSRPFTVVAGAVMVTATGTQFDVSRNEGRIAVTLMQGRVIVRVPDGKAITLHPGQQWRWPLEGAAVRTVNAANVVAWMQGRIVFDDMALADAIATVNRYGGKPVMLDAPGMAQERISGTFEAGDSQSFATAVTAFLPLQLRKDEEGNIHLAATK